MDQCLPAPRGGPQGRRTPHTASVWLGAEALCIQHLCRSPRHRFAEGTGPSGWSACPCRTLLFSVGLEPGPGSPLPAPCVLLGETRLVANRWHKRALTCHLCPVLCVGFLPSLNKEGVCGPAVAFKIFQPSCERAEVRRGLLRAALGQILLGWLCQPLLASPGISSPTL